jgi:hypothetical protein
MMKKPTPKMIPGLPELLAFARNYHDRHQHTPLDSERELPKFGCEVTAYDEDWLDISGPFGTSTRCRMMTLSGGQMRVRHLDLVKSLCKLLAVGVPIWANGQTQLDWYVARLAEAEPFEVPVVEEFRTRHDMEDHVDRCTQCAPAFSALVEAVNRGSNRTSDAHLQELITRCHEDPAAARKFYEGIRDSHAGTIFDEKRTRREAVGA